MASRWLRGPAGAVGLAVAASLLTAVVGVGHVRSADRLQARTQEALMSLQVGAVSAPGPGSAVVGHQTQVGLQVPLLNRGSRTASVAVLGLTAAHQRVVRRPEPVQIAPGTSTLVGLVVQVDCTQVADPHAGGVPAPSEAPSEALLARVAVPGGRRTVRLPLMSEASSDLTTAMELACSPLMQAVSTTWSASADGHLRVTVTDDDPPGAPDGRIVLQQSAGLGAVADPALPLEIAPGRTVHLDLSVQPDCAVVGDGSSSTVGLQLLDDTQQVVQDLSAGDGTGGGGAATWLARQLALRCR